MIDAQALAQLARLTDEWMDLTAAQRPQWREAMMRRHPALARAIASFTDADHDSATLPPVTLGAEPGTDSHADGSRVGPFRLLREIGRGGMGTVWLAEQADGRMQRRVALKLPMIDVAPRAWLARYSRERDILATLDHPGIAKLFDAGVADGEQPYLAMQFVPGLTLTGHADAHGLDLPARLRLFIELLDAVQHAHSALVVHRDLKPSNILVNDDGRVVLLDFGIAKLLDTAPPTPLEPGLTEMAGVALTLDYASPEQVAGRAIGTRSDTYSLGIVLYELLAGQRPYRLRRSSRAAMEEAVLEQDLLPPQRPDRARPCRPLRHEACRAGPRTARGPRRHRAEDPAQAARGPLPHCRRLAPGPAALAGQGARLSTARPPGLPHAALVVPPLASPERGGRGRAADHGHGGGRGAQSH
jgi:serine/threonine-protein kinase